MTSVTLVTVPIELNRPEILKVEGSKIPFNPTTPISWSVSFWLKITKPSTLYRNVIRWGANDTERGPAIFVTQNGKCLHTCWTASGNETVNTTDDVMPDYGVWFHFAMVISGRNVQRYINGKELPIFQLKGDPCFRPDRPFYVMATQDKNATGDVLLKQLKCFDHSLSPECFGASSYSHWAVNKKEQIFCFTGSEWESVDGMLTCVSMGPDGHVWGVNRNDQIFFRDGVTHVNPKGKTWRNIPGGLVQLSVGPDAVVWGVNGAGGVYFRVGVTESCPAGTTWKRIPGSLACVSIGITGSVWGVNNKDQIYHRVGISEIHPEGTGWDGVEGGLMQISVGDNIVWGVNRGLAVYIREGITGDNLKGTGWAKFDGKLKSVFVGYDRRVIGINDFGEHFVREGITSTDPKGTNWRKIMFDDDFVQISLGISSITGESTSGALTLIEAPIELNNAEVLKVAGSRIPFNPTTPIAWSVSFWMNIMKPNDQWRNVIHWGANDGERSPSVFINPKSRKLALCMDSTTKNNEVVWVSEEEVPDYGVWFHVCMVVEDKIVKSFINGEPITPFQLSGEPKFRLDRPFYVMTTWNKYATGDVFLRKLKCYDHVVTAIELEESSVRPIWSQSTVLDPRSCGRVSLGKADDIHMRNHSFTLETWIQIAEYEEELFKGEHWDYYIFFQDGACGKCAKLHVLIRGCRPNLAFFSNDLQGTAFILPGRWYHVCYRYDILKKEMAIFVNGILDSVGEGKDPLQGQGEVFVGGDASHPTVNGRIGYPCLFDTVLSDSQIRKRFLKQLEEYSFIDSLGSSFDLEPSLSVPLCRPGSWFGITNTSFTILAWVRRDHSSTKDEWILVSDRSETKDSKNNEQIHLGFRNDEIHLTFVNNATHGKQKILPRIWNHIAFRYDKDRKEQSIFLNGILENLESGHDPFVGKKDLLVLGDRRREKNEGFYGSILGLRKEKGALTESEIKEHIQRDLINFETSPFVRGHTIKCIGSPLISRSSSDTAGQYIAYVDLKGSIEHGGVVFRWRVYVHRPGDVQFAIFRPVSSGSNEFTVVGTTYCHFAQTGIVIFEPAESERISVNAGDHIGWRHPDGATGVISFDHNTDGQVMWRGCSSFNSGTKIGFDGSGPRTYSINCEVITVLHESEASTSIHQDTTSDAVLRSKVTLLKAQIKEKEEKVDLLIKEKDLLLLEMEQLRSQFHFTNKELERSEKKRLELEKKYEEEHFECLKYKNMLQAPFYSLKCLFDGNQIVAGTRVDFSIITSKECDVSAEDFHVIVDDSEIDVDDEYHFSWIPTIAGRYHLEVFLGDTAFIKNGNQEIVVTASNIQHVKIISNPPSELIAGRHGTFEVKALDEYDNEISVGGDSNKITVKGLQSTTYECEEAGRYRIEISSQKSGVFLCSLCIEEEKKDFKVIVKPGPISISMTKVENIEGMKLFQSHTIKIVSYDFYGNQCDIGGAGPFTMVLQGHESVVAQDKENGAYTCEITAKTFGEHELTGFYKEKSFWNRKINIQNHLSWTAKEVGEWLACMGYGQYSINLIRKNVVGKRLKNLNSQILDVTFGITDFDACTTIVEKIEDMEKMNPIDEIVENKSGIPDIIGDHYKVERIKETSGNVIVSAFDNKQNIQCVVKLTSEKESWEKERDVLLALRTVSGVINILSHFEDHKCGKYCYGIVLEKGYQSLAEKMSETLDLKDTELMDIVSRMIEAVISVEERHYSHGDIKPGNFIYMEDRRTLKLIDFDHAKRLDTDDVDEWTIPYMSPELARYRQYGGNKPKATTAMDVWSIGMISTELYLGYHPCVNEKDMEEFLAKLPKENAIFPLPDVICKDGRAYSFLRRCLNMDPKQRKSLASLREHPFAGGSRFTRTMIRPDDYNNEGSFKAKILNHLEQLSGFMAKQEVQMQVDPLVLQGMLSRMDDRLQAVGTLDDFVSHMQTMEEEQIRKQLKTVESIVQQTLGGVSGSILEQLDRIGNQQDLNREEIGNSIADVKHMLSSQAENIDRIMEEQRKYENVHKELLSLAFNASSNVEKVQHDFTEKLKNDVIEVVKRQNGDMISAQLQSLEMNLRKNSMGEDILKEVQQVREDVYEIRSRMNRKDLVVNVTYWEKDEKKKQEEFVECKTRLLKKDGLPFFHCRSNVNERKLELSVFNDENASFEVISCESIYMDQFERLNDGTLTKNPSQHSGRISLNFEEKENVAGRLDSTYYSARFPSEDLPPFFQIVSQSNEYISCKLHMVLKVRVGNRRVESLHFTQFIRFVVHDLKDRKNVIQKKDGDGNPTKSPYWRNSQLFERDDRLKKWSSRLISGVMLFLLLA